MIERRNGTIKSKRSLSNLLDSPFRMDQRSFSDVIGYLSLFLDNINYFNHLNEQDGNWSVLIEQDPVIYMVAIINEPTDELDLMIEHYDGIKTGGYDDNQVINTLLSWYEKIDKWYSTLLQLEEKKLAYKIKHILTDVLTYEKENLFHHQQKSLPEKGKDKTEDTSFQPMMLPPPPAPTPGKKADLGKAVHNFRKVIVYLQKYTEQYVEQSISSSNRHDPNNAMYIMFAQLYKIAQKELNTLSKRHLDFYFKEILRQQSSPGRPTSAIVNFDLLPHIGYSLIEKGARLSAGKLFGSKTDIIFETEKPLVAYQVELVELQTLLFKANPYIKVGTDKPLISSVSKNKLISKGISLSSPDEWFAFGANKQSVQNIQVDPAKTAPLGFIIASPVLLLTEGKREIDIRVNFDEDALQNPFRILLNEIKNNRKVSLETAFSDVFKQGFKISYTSRKGWLDFENYSVEHEATVNYFSIKLVLRNSDGPLQKSSKVEEKLSWPAIKVLLNEYAPVYLYSFFKGVQIDNIGIHVNVERIRDLSIYNNIGKMPLGKAFEIFGPIPEVGNYLLIGKAELFQKYVKTIEIDLEWESVPPDAGGFESYYSGYPENIRNDSFKVQCTALSNSYWLPSDLNDAPIFNLFGTTSFYTAEGYQRIHLNDTSTINWSGFDTLEIPPDYSLKHPLKYAITTPSGFVKLTLVSPAFGFGSESYQREFTEIATYNAKNKDQLAYPNKPFIPKVKGISVNYTASDILYFDKEFSKNTEAGANVGEFLHITPFAVETVISRQNVTKETLLPDFEAQGYLYLGLSKVKQNTTISIYFHFLHSSTGKIIREDNLTWEYFRVNRWVKFEEDEIILDETKGFVKSGIVELDLPQELGISNAPEDIYWIRISTRNDVPHYPIIKGIYINAVKATCINPDPLVMGKILPPGSIRKMEGKFPDIKKINQPAHSYGGVLPESSERFYTRVSERLRHKSRAVTTWDYERLILENFDEVHVVKCTNLDQTFKPVPGMVKVIVLSEKWTNNERRYFNEDSLDMMKTFLKKISNPFIDIQVVNPSVEYLLVNCMVQFMLEDNGGYYINQLNEDISDYLSPISNVDNGIGGGFMPTMLASFLENLPYIQKIKKLTIEQIVRHDINDYSLGVYKDEQEIKTTTPWSVLLPVEQHNIVSVINEDQAHQSLKVGIGNMKIGNDLILEETATSTSKTQSPDDGEKSSDKAKQQHNSIFVFENKSLE